MAAPAILDSALFAALAERQDRCELVDGEIISMNPPAYDHGEVTMQIGFLLKLHVRQTNADLRIIGECGFIWNERNVRAPDVAVVAAADGDHAPAKGFLPFAPLIAIEIISPSDSWREVHAKAMGWLAHGAKSVWVIDPVDRFVVVHLPNGTARELHAKDTLTDDQLPGFACPVADFFR